MDYRSYKAMDETMPRKGKINRKNHGKRNWNVKDVQAEEIRYKRKVKYQSYQFDEEPLEEGAENHGWD